MQNLFMKQQNIVLDNDSLRRGFTVLVSLPQTVFSQRPIFTLSTFHLVFPGAILVQRSIRNS